MTLRPLDQSAYPNVLGCANCTGCALTHRRDETYCPAQIPVDFNGLMIVGEGPGATESRLKRPFIGKSGQLLDALLKEAGIDREATYITNASICLPEYAQSDKDKDKQVQSAIEHCHPRLVAEIEMVRPRVILALGTYAIRALTGQWVTKTKREPRWGRTSDGTPYVCPTCYGQMTLAWWKCPSCKGANLLPVDPANPGVSPWTPDAPVFGNVATHHKACEECAAPSDLTCVLVQKRKKRCPECAGKKTVDVDYQVLESDYTVTSCAGLVFRGPEAPDFAAMDEGAQVVHPCRYLIGSYHPSFLDREAETKTQKKTSGQFLVNASIAHFRKAARLLEEDAAWSYTYRVVPDHIDRDAGGPRRAQLAEAGYGLQADAIVATETLEQTLAELDQYLAWGATQLFTSIDIETDNRSPWDVTQIRCIGFHGLGAHSLVVNTEGLTSNHPIIERLRVWLEDPAIPKALQNGIYDLQVMWHIWGVELQGYVYDTLVAHNAIHPDEPHNLGHITGTYTDAPPWKPAKKKGGIEVYETREELFAYNGRDVLNTTLSMEVALGRLDAEGARFVHDLDVAMFHVARDMERAGLPIEPGVWGRWSRRAAFYTQRNAALIRHYVGRDDFNPDSSAQLQWALFDPQGPCRLIPTELTPTGAPATSRPALLAHRDHPFVQILLDHRRWGKVGSTILGQGKKGNESKLGADWRMRTRWNPLGARTGRWSSGSGGDEGDGRKGNFQNWTGTLQLLRWVLTNPHWDTRDGPPPVSERYDLELFEDDAQYLREGKDDAVIEMPGVRELVVAPPGRKLVGADSSQAELRVLAALSGDTTLIQKCKYADESRKLEPDHDPHSYVCAIAFGDAFLKGDNETRKRLRDLEKRVIYGSFYGAGPNTIAASINNDMRYLGPPLDDKMVERILHAIFTAFSGVKDWQDEEIRQAQKTGKVWDGLIGRRREFPLGKVMPTIALNFKMQSTVGSMMNMSLWELRHRLPAIDPTAVIIAQVHDAIYIECDEDRADRVAAALENAMSQELRFVDGAEFMPFPATAKIKQSWQELG